MDSRLPGLRTVTSVTTMRTQRSRKLPPSKDDCAAFTEASPSGTCSLTQKCVPSQDLAPGSRGTSPAQGFSTSALLRFRVTSSIARALPWAPQEAQPHPWAPALWGQPRMSPTWPHATWRATSGHGPGSRACRGVMMLTHGQHSSSLGSKFLHRL